MQQEHINRYKIIEKIGEGAGCSVYKAFDPAVNRQLAIKILHSAGHNPKALEQFLRETRVIGKLTHPGIATVYDIGEEQGRAYIAMELLSGEFLDDALISGRQFSWEEVIDIGRQIASALQYAHKQGVIHADLRPGNIAWFAAEKRVLLTDFSHALRDYIASEPTVRLKEEPSKSAYMSPEQVLGSKLDARSDLFSLGTLLYQLLTGRRPFSADTMSGLTEQITRQRHKPLSAERLGVHQQRLIQIIERLLEKDPQARYQSCDELLVDFDKLVRELTVEGGRQNAGQRRNKLVLGVTLGIALLSVLVYLAKTPPSVEPVSPEPPPTALNPPIPETPIPENQAADAQVPESSPSPLRATINQQLAQFECAALSVQLDADNRAVVSGHVAQEDDMMRLMDVMEGVVQLQGITYEVTQLAWPLCEAAAILSPTLHSNVQNDTQLQIHLKHPVLTKKLFSAEFQNANTDSFVYVDFYSKEGEVFHLYPQLGAAQQIVPAGASLRVEYNLASSGISLENDGLFAMLTSSQPLALEVRHQREPAQDYLSRLYRRVVVDKSPLLATYEVTSLAD